MKRREAKSKGEKERYTHLNAEFQRIARRDKKAFLAEYPQSSNSPANKGIKLSIMNLEKKERKENLPQ